MVIGLEDLCVSYFLAPKKLVASKGSVDLELQHGEEELLKEFVQVYLGHAQRSKHVISERFRDFSFVLYHVHLDVISVVRELCKLL